MVPGCRCVLCRREGAVWRGPHGQTLLVYAKEGRKKGARKEVVGVVDWIIVETKRTSIERKYE